MTKITFFPRLMFSVISMIVLLAGCSLQNEPAPSIQAKATYQILANTANKDISIEDIKPIIDYRARQNRLKNFNSEIIDNQLILTADQSQLTPIIAKQFTEINQLSIGEKRKNFTTEELARKKTYNEGQKEVMNRAYEEATNNPEDFDSIVEMYTESESLLDKSIHNYQRKDGIQKEVADTLFGTGTGSITKLITTPNMVWFAKVLDKREQEEVTAQHILISYIGAKTKNPYLYRTKAQAEKFVNEIKDTITPKNFSEKAKEFSDDTSSSKGGNLGNFPRGHMAPAFDKAAFEGELNKVIGPIETEFGWHFILVNKKESVPFVKYQDIVRLLKPLTPQSGYVPALYIGNKIRDIKPQVKSTPVVGETGSGSTMETSYRLVITFNDEGKQMIMDFAKTHKDLSNLAFMIDDAPYWKLTKNDQITSDGTIILEGELTEEHLRNFDSQMKSYSLPTAIQLVDYEVVSDKK